MAAMSERTDKSIFARKQTYSRKGNSKSRPVRAIVEEADRKKGACPHVENPLPPTILEGIPPSEIVAVLEERIAAQNKVLRRLRKERPDSKDDLRNIRRDTHVLIGADVAKVVLAVWPLFAQPAQDLALGRNALFQHRDDL